MQEREVSLSDMFFCALRKWRKAIVFAIVCAILAGAVAAVIRVVEMNDPEKVEEWQNEYDIAYGAYWAAINDFDRQISVNEILASKAQTSIDRLNRAKSEYEARLRDMEAQKPLYENRIDTYERNIANLEHELEKLEYYLGYRKKHNENNLLMKIDPYSVNIHDIFLRVDSGYEILPGNSYQNTDPTAEILQTYQLFVNNTSFYDKMIADLNLETEVQYITDLISVSTYGKNSIHVRVMSDNSDWAHTVCDYIADAILAEHDRVQASVAAHKIEAYEERDYTTVDTGIYSKQYSYNQEVLDYEASIRGVNTSILNTDASIRSINAEIRALDQQITELRITIDNLPLEIKTLEDTIAGYSDANYTLRTEQLELLKEPEPQYAGYTTTSIFTGFVKFAVIGGAIGAVLAFVYFAVVGIMKGKALSSKQVCETLNSEFFGFWPNTSNKKSFASIDEWIDNLSGCTVKGMSPEVATDLVLSNIAVACAGSKKVMLCGGASKEVIAEVAEAVKAQLNGADIIYGGTLGLDPVVVRGMAECDAIVLVEQLDQSVLDAAIQLKERAQAMNKPILGVVVHN